jgi:hypothetical protein
MCGHGMQNNERNYHQHDSNKHNVSLPFEDFKTHSVHSAIMILFHLQTPLLMFSARLNPYAIAR